MEKFECSPTFPLQPATAENLVPISTGKQEGYYLQTLKNGLVNLHFSPLEIIRRQDLLQGKDVPSLGLNGYMAFEKNCMELFEHSNIGILPLSIKYKGHQVNLYDFFPQLGLTLQAVGFKDHAAFYNSSLLIEHRPSHEKFVVKFVPPNSGN